MIRGKLIYVASPYTHPDNTVQEWRFLSVAIVTGWLMNHYQDKSFYSPITHTHPIAIHCKLPGHWEFWKQFDEVMISRSDEIWVLCIDGWETSKGIQGELEIAKEFGLPVKFITPLENGEYAVCEAA